MKTSFNTREAPTRRKCPFCRQHGQRLWIDDKAVYVGCKGCGAHGPVAVVEWTADGAQIEAAVDKAVKLWDR